LTLREQQSLILDAKPIAGVYAIFNKRAGKVYVGSSINIANRYKDHLKLLSGGRHHSPHLQRAWNIDGPEAFIFKLICPVTEHSEMLSREQYWMDFFASYDDAVGYNMCPTSGNCLGRILSAETREKIGRSHKGKPLTENHKSAISLGGRGRVVSKEVKARLSFLRRGTGASGALLNDEKVKTIKVGLLSGRKQKDLALEHGVSRQTITNIATGHRWKHVQ
jgi:group I intron endonuclease